MKALLYLILAVLMLLRGCTQVIPPDQSQTDASSGEKTFIRNENGNIVSSSGDEYSLVANEGILYYFGELDFIGSIQGEEKTSQHLGLSYQTGMFKIKDAASDNILIRYAPNNEWFAIYRKASLPDLDIAVDNCIRLEFVSGIGNIEEDAIHTTCGDGIFEKAEIGRFLSEIRAQKDPREAGLYDMIKKPDGMLENCYVYGVVYGFFEEEPDLAVQMVVTSFNDWAYSISVEGKEYVLPAEWLQELENK